MFSCVTVIIIVPRLAPEDWMRCATIWIDCDGFDFAVRLKEELESITVRSVSVKCRNSPAASQYSYLFIVIVNEQCSNHLFSFLFCISLFHLLSLFLSLLPAFDISLFPFNCPFHCTHLLLSCFPPVVILFFLLLSFCSKALLQPAAQAHCRFI